jgi:hypothetical protein
LRSENARLARLLDMRPGDRVPPGPVQTGMFDARPGPVRAGSSPAAKVAFFGALFAARTDVYATRWENRRTGRSGWLPAVRGGWRKGVFSGLSYLVLDGVDDEAGVLVVRASTRPGPLSLVRAEKYVRAVHAACWYSWIFPPS